MLGPTVPNSSRITNEQFGIRARKFRGIESASVLRSNVMKIDRGSIDEEFSGHDSFRICVQTSAFNERSESSKIY